MAVKKLPAAKARELSEAYLKVLRWFFSFPDREIGLNDLSEALRVSKTTAKKVVLQLVEEGFLNKEILGKIWRISCNQNHDYNFTYKISWNLTLVLESFILKAVHDILRNPKAVILFGSYRKGDDNEKSDIDIAVEFGNINKKDASLFRVHVLGRVNDKIDVQVYDVLPEKIKKEIDKNGRIIYERKN